MDSLSTNTYIETIIATNISNIPKTKFDLPYLIDNVLYYITIRRLTPRECFRLQGFPVDYKLPELSSCHLYKQAGNSIVVNVLEEIFKKLFI